MPATDPVVERRLVHGDDPPERPRRRCGGPSRPPRVAFDKPKWDDKIDAVVALCMALDRMQNRPAPTRLVGWL